ncbi:hypothetical protein NQ317_017930 [Molorchus minor]|uniref:Notch ligand N-terminal domain-containing protein n=1 Tax=Molorchus minor TaxID=1323400 RepID=A0ABQ9ITR1_9CUCU|nr:hypothetical protein NQ317_017930 [Molorchus minor]
MLLEREKTYRGSLAIGAWMKLGMSPLILAWHCVSKLRTLCTHGSGFFELQVLEMANPRSELSNGECCGGGVRNPVTNRCSIPCNTFFRLCLKEYQSNVTSTGSCSFGNTSSQVLGRDTFTLADPDRGKLVLPFTFRWTRTARQSLPFVVYEVIKVYSDWEITWADSGGGAEHDMFHN